MTNIRDVLDKREKCWSKHSIEMRALRERNEVMLIKNEGNYIKTHRGVVFYVSEQRVFIRGDLFMFLGKVFLAKGRKEVSRYCFDYFPLLIANAVN